MSEKLLTPLEVMPVALRHSMETILKKHQRLGQNPSAASSSSLSKPYEALKSLWKELQWEPYVTDLQQRETSLTQQQAARPKTVQQQLGRVRGAYARSFQERRQSLGRRKQHLAQRKQALRDSMLATRQELSEKLRLLTLPLEQLIEHQLLSYTSEWNSAEQRIATQNELLQQAEANYPNVLQQHKNTLRTALEKIEQLLNEQQRNAPLTLQRLQQWNAQKRSALPGLFATWKAAAAVRETSLREELADWNASHQTSADELPSWPDLNASGQQLSDWRQTLTEKSQQLQQRKQLLSHAEQTMHAEWQRVSRKPSFSAPQSNEQRTDWQRKSRPLKDSLSDLRQLMMRCASIKAELLTAGLLSPEQYPEIDSAWAELELGKQ